MATMPAPGQMLTGDPELAAAGAQSGATPSTGPTQNDLSITAQRWANHWNAPQAPPPAAPLRRSAPGTPGFGVLDDSRQSGNEFFPKRPGTAGTPGYGVLDDTKRPDGGFYATRPGQAERNVANAIGRLEADRARLQGIADSILGTTAMPTDLGELWGWALEQMTAAEVMGSDPQDPWYWLEQRKAQAEADQAEKSGPSTVTQTQRTINLTDPTTAAAVIDSTLRNLLGRRATDEEREQFMSTLRATEQANPTVTTSTTTTTPSENGLDSTVDTSSTTTGGAPDAGTAAQAFADDELLGEQKAVLAGQYYNILKGL